MSAQHHVFIMTLLTMVRGKVHVKPKETKELRSLLYCYISNSARASIAAETAADATLISILKTDDHQLMLGGKTSHVQCNLIHE